MNKMGLCVAVVCVLVAGCGQALAHAFLDHALPKVGAQVPVPPPEVRVWFTDDVDPAASTIEVLDPDGQRVDKQDLHADTRDKRLLIVSLPRLAAGTYRVNWHATCACCGQKTQGSFKFTVQAGA